MLHRATVGAAQEALIVAQSTVKERKLTQLQSLQLVLLFRTLHSEADDFFDAMHSFFQRVGTGRRDEAIQRIAFAVEWVAAHYSEGRSVKAEETWRKR